MFKDLQNICEKNRKYIKTFVKRIEKVFLYKWFVRVRKHLEMFNSKYKYGYENKNVSSTNGLYGWSLQNISAIVCAKL